MIDIALKEWAVICDLLVEGRQALVLRKGGVHEEGGPGRFRLEHDRFALFPAWEHQYVEGLKPEFRERVEAFETEPSSVSLSGWAEVAKIWEVSSRSAFDGLDDLHGWAKPQVDMRFGYKPDRPLYLLALRVYRLAEPKVIGLTERHWGCKSWVPLEAGEAVDEAGAEPALGFRMFERVVERIETAMG